MIEGKFHRLDGPQLESIKNRIEYDMISDMSSNAGLASQLGYYEAVTNDWGFLFHLIEQMRAVTAADVQRVLNTYIIPSNKTVAVLVRKK
jgi:predicted Zn-dependent peptidase